MPKSSMTCGFEEAPSVMLIVPRSDPNLMGEKVAVIVQFAPGATVAPQVDVVANPALGFID